MRLLDSVYRTAQYRSFSNFDGQSLTQTLFGLIVLKKTYITWLINPRTSPKRVQVQKYAFQFQSMSITKI